MGNKKSYFVLFHSTSTRRSRLRRYMNKKVNKFWQLHATVAGLNKHIFTH